MDRRQFVAASALFPLISTQTMAAVCENGELSRTAYDDLLRSVRQIAKSGHDRSEAIELAITKLAELDPKQSTHGAVLKLIDVALKNEDLIADIDAFVNDFNGPESALNMLRTQPEVFLDRPPAVALSNRLAKVLKRDATLFLLAANKLGTDSYLKHLPPNLPVTRDPDRLAQEAEAKKCASVAAVLSVIVAVMLIVVAVIIAAVTFGASSALVVGSTILAGLVIGGSVAARTGGILGDEFDEIASEIKDRIEEGIQERARIYTRHAVSTAKQCALLLDEKERAACLEASLLLCANAY